MRVLLLRSVESWVAIQILWDTFRSQIAELWFPYDRTIAIDRRRSQKCVSIWSQTIAELFAICDPRSAIVCDHMETSLNFIVPAYSPHKRTIVMWSARCDIFFERTLLPWSWSFSLQRRFRWNILYILVKSKLPRLTSCRATLVNKYSKCGPAFSTCTCSCSESILIIITMIPKSFR